MYFKISRGCYGLPQSGMLSNKQLRLRLEKEGYYKARTTLGLWRHKWRPISFFLVIDNFGVEYVGKQHTERLATKLKKYHRAKYVCFDIEIFYLSTPLGRPEYVKIQLSKIPE